MKTYQIVLLDKVTNQLTKVKNFKETEKWGLEQELHNLQLGYCEDETPDVFSTTKTSGGLLLKVIVAESDSDFAHVAVTGKV